MAVSLVLAGLPDTSFGVEESAESPRVIQYRGPLPMLGKETWGREIELRFELYRSPTGGVPFWSETRKLTVAADGWVQADLGQVTPLPEEALATPFRFLSIWRADVEFVPRKQVVSVVYVASSSEAGVAGEDYVEQARVAAKAAADRVPDREQRLDALVQCGDFSMETHPRHAATWLEAAETARRLNARLPTFEEWYRAYDGKAGSELIGLAGHYEWVVPWVYEPAIHARLNELYRGKPVACYYNELSPLNAYPFRLVQRTSVAR